jgi:uncharacterized protein YkwD
MRFNHFAGAVILALSGACALSVVDEPGAPSGVAAQSAAAALSACSAVARQSVTVPAPKGGHSAEEMEVVARTIAVRQRGCRCPDGTTHAPAGALAVSARLRAAAVRQSTNMARDNFFAHEDPEGARVQDRVNAAGYRWRTVGENLAAGPRDAVTVVVGWADSAGHCRNLMSRNFTEIGVALVRDPQDGKNVRIGEGETSGPFYTYWTQVFGAPY